MIESKNYREDDLQRLSVIADSLCREVTALEDPQFANVVQWLRLSANTLSKASTASSLQCL